MMVEFKVVEGSRGDALLLTNGMRGVPEMDMPTEEMDRNELHRFAVREDRLAECVPRFAELEARVGRLTALLARCIPFVEGGCDGAEWDDMANDLIDDVNAAIGEAVA